MSNYVHDLADRVLGYRDEVAELVANPPPPADPDGFYSCLHHFMNQPHIAADAVSRFDALETIKGGDVPVMDRTSTLYVQTIFPYRIPKFIEGKTSYG